MKEKFARWHILFLQYAKRDYKKIIFWVLGLGAFSGAYVPAFEEIAKGTGLIGMYETMQNPAMISMVGPTPVQNAADYNVGAMYSNEMLLFCGLFAMIISALHVVGHTRKEEDLGLTELVRSFQVGRQSNSLAVIIETVVINLLLGAVTAIILMSFGATSITPGGSVLFGASIAAAGLIGAVIALVLAQIMPNSSSATGASLGIVGLLYILRAGTDVTNVDLSMLNPMGWVYLTYPFTENNVLPLLYVALFSLVLIVAAFMLEGKRDMGAGYLPEREGRAEAKKSLLSVSGLFFKINKGVIIGWLVAFVVMGAAYGSIYGDMQSFLESNDLVKQMFTQSGVSIEESFTATIMMVLVSLVSILPIAIINKLFVEESRLRLSQIYASKVTRSKLYWTTISLALISAVLGILLGVGSLGATAMYVMKGKSVMDMGDFLASGFNFLPSVLFFAGLAALIFGFVPKFTKLVYAYLGYSFALNYFSGILDLPDWFLKTAIQSYIPQMPVDHFDAPTFITITVIGIAFIILGYLGYKNRDLIEGA
ncbi:tetronasin resistance protein [Listeria fleischmannii]|uniref:ABC transporter permease n=1 Tax=Listeria fleischmannii TaxID=1069827 RepID=UPI001629D1A9|nr:tetronasin resistance protein [Listeria fleischmannii]MBC1427248.1 tetronasin resistance protein [Listeria fleischmannii]